MTDDSVRIDARDGRFPGQRIVSVAGRMVFPTKAQAVEFLEHIRVEMAPVLILDLSAVAFCDSSGVGVLVTIFEACRRENRRFALAASSDRVRFVLGIAQLLSYLTMFPTVEEAENALVPG
jgi:anti-sigma B factor antagonist